MDHNTIKRSRDAAWVYATFDLFDPSGELTAARWPTLNDWVAFDLNKNVYVSGGRIEYAHVIEVVERLAGIKPQDWDAPAWVPKKLKPYFNPVRFTAIEANKQILLEIFNISFNDWPKKSEDTVENTDEAKKAPVESAIGLIPAIAIPLVKMTGLNILQIANLPIRVISQLIRIDSGITDAPETNEWVADMLLQLNSNNKKG